MASTPSRATHYRVSTPPPPSPSAIHTPAAPLHGYSDSWEPYSPRKSARISERTNNRTPSPHKSARRSTTNNIESLGSPKSKRRAPIATPATMSPKKKRTVAFDQTALSGTQTSEGTQSTFGKASINGRASLSVASGMLITPAKTPQKPPSQQTRENIQAVARSLFSETEAMPSPRRSRAQKSLLGSFADDEEEPIAIFTDSRERIPEVDRSNENPFYDQRPAYTAEAPRRSPRRQTVAIPGEGHVLIEDAVRRTDGMVIVFRGKKQFRKFASTSDAHHRSDLDDEAGLESHLERPHASTQVKPRRLLFPPKKEPVITTDDEEAPTDIEDAGEAENTPTTPMELTEEAPNTPAAPKFAPASPPTTARTTRFTSKLAETTPVKGKKKLLRGGSRSPFDVWPRTKGPEGQGQKRSGESLGSSSKRTRI